jgi:HEAT repeat protein
VRLLLTATLFVLCLGCAPQREPSYDGKPLSHWESMAASENREDRTAAAKTLGEIGPDGLAGLTKLLRDRDNQTKAMAGLAVARMGAKAVPRLIELLQSPDDGTRLGAALALRHVDPGAQPAVPALTELLQDENPNVRRAAAQTLHLLALERGETKGRPARRQPPAEP